MCSTCGCSDEAGTRIDGVALPRQGERPHEHAYEHGDGPIHEHGHGHDRHDHSHEHGAGHGHDHAESRTVVLEQDVLAKNDALAVRNRSWLDARGITAINLMSSPGSGKTTLLEHTIGAMAEAQDKLSVSVVEGDQETLLDAERIRATGCRVVQINTGAGCHLDAEMLASGLEQLDPPQRSVVLIENVGNLVCPALFDLGEHARVVIMSAPEGEGKPLKYPHMFRSTDLVLLNKTDLLPHLDFDTDRFAEHLRAVSPGVDVLPVSASRGDGMAEWYGWLRTRGAEQPSPAPAGTV